MKYLQLILFLISISYLSAFAQPANNECSGLIDLGIAPICETSNVFSNLGATASNTGGTPSCFVSGGTQRDVWFAFTTTTDIETYFITVQGANNGTSGEVMSNPQLTFYRGSCGSLSELGCISADNGEGSVVFSISNLPAGQQFILRVNDYTASATPNAGDFSICIEEKNTVIMGESTSTDACRGTLLDSGGLDGDYMNNEDLLYTICPSSPHSCILLEFEQFDLENNFDVLTIHAGDDRNAPILARVTGSSTNANFPVQTESDCVTIHFDSDATTQQAGFELTWQCEAALCFPTSDDRVTRIPQELPFIRSLSTCGVAASFGETACGSPIFLNGPEHILRYNSPGDVCVSITLNGASEGTGIMVLDALPNNPNANCVISQESSTISSVDMSDPGNYFIVIANPFGCTDFDIIIDEADCSISPSLQDALCNPLNGCIEDGGVPSLFVFQEGFQDITLLEGENSGCWQNAGEVGFFWFTIEAQADGKFGFILESADIPSDIDFNVWGPFTPDNACRDQADIIQFIEQNQPIRSSWAAPPGRTGLTNVHPLLRYPILDEFDCLSVNNPSALGDNFVRRIDVQEGEVYAILINDFQNTIESNSILVDWSPSDANVLAPIPIEILNQDTSVCLGQSVQLGLETTIDDIIWSPAESLSCTRCPNPIATPRENTTYRAIVEGVCVTDTVEVEVKVFGIDLEPRIIVCLNESIELEAGSNFEGATYEWSAPQAVELSCTDCPNPIVTANTAGTFDITVRLDAPTCPAFDRTTLTVLPQTAPEFEIIDDIQICIGASPLLGNLNNSNENEYAWTSVPAGFTSTEGNPSVTPAVTTTYFVNVQNGNCPVTSIDSVLVEVFETPEVSVVSDTAICQGEILQLSFDTPEEDVIYRWVGPNEIIEEEDLNTLFEPERSGTYGVTASRGICSTTERVQVDVTRIKVEFVDDLMQSIDSLSMCLGDTLELRLNAETPEGILPEWTPVDGSLSDTLGIRTFATPETSIMYYAQAANGECISIDSIMIYVDSLPESLGLMPLDTMICQGNYVVLTSEVYEPSLYPNIEHQWFPFTGQQTPDSLFNMVVSPPDPGTYVYERITGNGECISRDTATVLVNPLPEIRIISDQDAICPGEVANLSVELLNPEEVTIESYMWEPEDILDPNDEERIVTSMGGITYNVQVQSDKMCPGGASYFLENAAPPALQLPVNPELCLGESIQLNNIIGNDVTYTWTSEPAGFTSSLADPIVSPTVTTTYTVVAESLECPPTSQSVTVVIIPQQTFSVEPMDATVCIGESIELTATATGVGIFDWSTGPSDVGTSSTITVTPTNSVDINVIYRYGGPDNMRCGSQEDFVTLDVIESINIDTIGVSSRDSIIYEGDPLELFIITDQEVNDNDIIWTTDGIEIGRGAMIGTEASATPGEITYTATVTNDFGCEVSDTITINVLESIIAAPNVFAPAKRNNSVFYPVTRGNITLGRMVIFDRWGREVYETSDFSRSTSSWGWNGKRNNTGDGSPSDIYVYVINYTIAGRAETLTGEVLLLR